MALDDLMAALNATSKNTRSSNVLLQSRDALSQFQFAPSRKERETGKVDVRKDLMGKMGMAILGGIFGGLGEKQVRDQNNFGSQRLVSAMTSADPVGALANDPEYSSLAPMLQIEQIKNQQLLQAKRAEKAMEFGYQQLGSGRVFDQSTGQFTVAPGYAQTEAYNTAIPEAAKQEAQYGAKLQYEPMLKQQDYQLQAQYEPGIAAAKESATRSAGLPFLGQEELIKAKAEAHGALLKEGVTSVSPKALADFEKGLRAELQSIPPVRSFPDLDRNFQSMVNTYKRTSEQESRGEKPSGVSDLDYIFGIMKVLDETSVVREGEQTRVVQTGGIPGRVYSLVKAVRGGQRLTPQVRKELLELAGSRYDGTKQIRDSYVNNYKRLAEEKQANPGNIDFYPARESSQEYLRPLFAPPAPAPGGAARRPGETPTQYMQRLKGG